MEHKTVKILHMGDVFLDCPFSSMRAAQSERRRAEVRETFVRAVEIARAREISVILITGNLFDRHYATPSTVSFLHGVFASSPDIRFLICPGPHDHYEAGSIYDLGRFPGNVHIFSSKTATAYPLPSLGVTVYGWAFTDETYDGDPLEGFLPAPDDGVRILAGYGTVDGESRYAAMSVYEIGQSHADYVALTGGSLHNGFERSEDVIYAYSGALEHSSYAEPGFGGVNLVTVTPDAPVRVETQRELLGRRRYAAELFDITGADTANEILSRITQVIEERKYGPETALKVILTGETAIGTVLPATLGSEHFGLYSFELEDRTTPAFDESAVARDMTVRGEICRTLIPVMRTGTESERQTASRALRIGLAALEGRDLTDL